MLHTETMTIAWITLAKGAVVPRHEHTNEQIATVLEGRLRFLICDERELVADGGRRAEDLVAREVGLRSVRPREGHGRGCGCCDGSRRRCGRRVVVEEERQKARQRHDSDVARVAPWEVAAPRQVVLAADREIDRGCRPV